MQFNEPLFSALIVFIVIGIPVLCVTLIILAKIFKGSSSRQRDKSEMEEMRMLQDIHSGLQKLENRIEALETIIIEPKRK